MQRERRKQDRRFPCLVGSLLWYWCSPGCPTARVKAKREGSVKKFVLTGSAKGWSAEMCTNANAGKRYWLEGYLQLSSSISIRDGRADLQFYDRIDANGRGTGDRITIYARSPGDIDDLWASATSRKTTYAVRGSRKESAQVDDDALRIRTKNGAATARDRIKLAFDIEVTKHFQTGEVYSCSYNFARAEKI
jgi:hypothetical protein